MCCKALGLCCLVAINGSRLGDLAFSESHLSGKKSEIDLKILFNQIWSI